jgi:hypothetical protein
LLSSADWKEGDSKTDILAIKLKKFGNQLHKEMEDKKELRFMLEDISANNIGELVDQKENWVWNRY